MIRPTVGRSIHYYPQADDPLLQKLQHISDWQPQPLTALLCGVISDRCINIAVFGADGSGPYARQNVVLVQEGDPQQEGVSYAAWMDYQKGQAVTAKLAEDKLQQLREQFEAGRGKLIAPETEQPAEKIDDKLKELAAQSSDILASENPASAPASDG